MISTPRRRKRVDPRVASSRLRALLAVAGLAPGLILASCQRQPTAPVPFVSITETGLLHAANTSLIRRGTHVLSVRGEGRYLLESKVVNLQEYEEEEVVVEGTLEPNTSTKDLPVLVVSGVQPLHRSTATHSWRIPALGIGLRAPDDWSATIQDTTALLRRGSEQYAILTIFAQNPFPLPEGTPVYADGMTGVRVRTGDHGEDVHLPLHGRVITLQFRPILTPRASQKEFTVLSQQFHALLLSLHLLSAAGSSAAAQPTTSSVSSLRCGGEAGILCRPGFYCEITDTQTKIGYCRKR